MMTVDLSGTWPAGGLDLLLRAALHRDRAAAAAAWSSYETTCDFNAATWSELRLMPAVARRLASLDIASPLRPRVAGVARYMWTQAQSRLRSTEPLLRALAADGVQLLLIKGAARAVGGPESAAERTMTDVDVVVPKDMWGRAIDIAFSLGWTTLDGRSREETFESLRRRTHSRGLRKGAIDIDLHRFALLPNRNLGDDEALWARSRPAVLAGLPVRIPAPEDALVIAATHGLLFDPARSADWVLDLVACIDRDDLDWSLVCDSFLARGTSAYGHTALSYAVSALGLQVPAGVLGRLADDLSPAFAAEMLSQWRGYRTNDINERAALREAAFERSRRAAARTWRPIESPGRSERVVAEMALDKAKGEFTIRLPHDLDPASDARLDIAWWSGWPRRGGAVQMIVDCLEWFPIEIGRWRSRHEGRFAAWPPRGRFTLIIPAAFLILREIPSLRLRVEAERRPAIDTAGAPVRALTCHWTIRRRGSALVDVPGRRLES